MAHVAEAQIKIDEEYKDGTVYVKPKNAWKPGKCIYNKISGQWVGQYNSILLSEDFSSFANKDTIITDYPSAPSATSWNGAKPPNPSWSLYVNDGNVIFQPHVEENGNVYMKMSPMKTGGRMQIIFRFPQDLYNLFKNGDKYTVYADFRGIDNPNFKAQIQIKTLDYGNPISTYVLSSEWKTVAHDFIFSSTKEDLDVVVGIEYHGGSKGTLCIDNIRLEKTT